MNNNYITGFYNAVKRRGKHKNILYFMPKSHCGYSDQSVFSQSELTLPSQVDFYIKNIIPITILSKNKTIELLGVNDIELLENRFLKFSVINNNEIICFDTLEINSAGEWDILNYNNKFVITKTIPSFLTNKIWAWIDRDKNIFNNL